ncbi:MAG: iron-containing alcohol dehydrogenase [Actinobacteria bacterium]|nr:iron-containing alcohol dehydrogenase [Actinomycetota bacterium]
MIVRWGPLSLVADVCDELGVNAPLLVASPRWDDLDFPLVVTERWSEVPSTRVEEAASLAGDSVVAVGGGSAIDLGKAISAASGLPLVSVPTTYSGAEWTTFYGVRDTGRRMRGGGGGSRNAGIVYDVGLTVGLPLEPTVGTAMNALCHCAEALYAHGHNPETDEIALDGARLVATWLPRVVDAPDDRDYRTELLRGACHGGEALAGSMLALAHAMAQAIGGKYGLPHGTLNGICLPPVLRYNARYAPVAVRAFGEAVDGDPAARVEELTALGGITRLSQLGVPEADLPELAASTAQRGGNQANPHPATPQEILELLRSVW